MIGDMLRGARRALAGLKPMRVPEAPSRAFRDLWPGDATRGARLLRGEYEVAGTARPLRPAEPPHVPPTGWGSDSGSPAWRAAVHGFAWLRDLRALGTDQARILARSLAADWLATQSTTRSRCARGAGARISPPGSATGTSSPPPPMTACGAR
jgi:uncharacterized heparinase superfamily protein